MDAIQKIKKNGLTEYQQRYLYGHLAFGPGSSRIGCGYGGTCQAELEQYDRTGLP